MSDTSHDEAISTFQGITGADAPTAEHVLEAHAWDLTRGINFFLENGGSVPAPAYEAHSNRPIQSNGPPVRGGDEDDQVMDYDSDGPRLTRAHEGRTTNSARTAGRSGRRRNVFEDEDSDDEDYQPPSVSRSGGVRGTIVEQERGRKAKPDRTARDSEYKPSQRPAPRGVSFEALNEGRERQRAGSGQTRNGNQGSRRPSEGSAVDLSSDSSTSDEGEDDDNNLAVVEPESQPSPQTRSGGRAAVRSHQVDDDDDNDLEIMNGSHPARGNGNDGLTSSFGPSRFPFPAPAFQPVGAFNHFRQGNGSARGSIDLDNDMIPDGIDVEEAKMLEAAMMGVPYRGRIPDFDAEPRRPTLPEDPAVIQQRLLREEQDQAYQDSLLADIEKKSAAEAAERAEQEQRLQVVREKEAAEQAQRDYEQEIEHKMLNLPEEPPVGTTGAITVMIRTPKGARFGRRFLTSDSVRHLFWFADVNAAPDFRPGAYNLVTQFPRKVLNSDLEGSLAEAGLTQKQEALFLEAS